MDWSFSQVTQSELNKKLEYKYIGTWADKPDPSTLQYGDLIYITNNPEYFGSVWSAVPLFGIYAPQTGNVFIGADYLTHDSDDSGTDQIIKSTAILENYLFSGSPLDFDVLLSKSGTTDSATIKLRLGTEGDLSDPVFATFTMSAADRKLRVMPSAQITSATTINCQSELIGAGSSTAAWADDVTIPDVSNALTLSLSVELSGTTDTVTCHSFYAIQRGFG